MSLTMQRASEPRCTIGPDKKLYVGVTSAMRLVKRVLQEPPDSYGPEALARIHQLEGTACHAVCLDWLADAFGWLPTFEMPPMPLHHGDERRWFNVLLAALIGFKEFVQLYEVEPIGIEQESFSAAYGLVGHLDLYCTLKRKGKGRRLKAVVDLKFVRHILLSHYLQVRCYGKLDGFKEAQLGLLFHCDRNTGLWKTEEVDLTAGLHDMMAVANAARLYAWGEGHRSTKEDS